MTWDISSIFLALWTYIWLTWIRPAIKGFLRITTGLCELQRICYSTHGASSDRCIEIEKSLLLSRSSVIHRVRDRLIFQADVKKDPSSQSNQYRYQKLSKSDDSGIASTSLDSNQPVTSPEEEAQLINYAVEAICLDKKIKTNIHKEFVFSLRTSLTQLYYYKKVIEEAEDLRKTSFDRNNKEHCQLLVGLWNNLKEGEGIKTISECSKWSDIGFQQDSDPTTDFRGMGLLGLTQLLFLTQHHSSTAKSMLLTSSHPLKGYPFAITGINMTHLVLSLMKAGHLKNHFLNLSTENQPYFTLEELHRVYCYIFMAFSRFWIQEDPRDVMEFTLIREKFVRRLKSHLTEPKSDLIKWSCPVIDVI